MQKAKLQASWQHCKGSIKGKKKGCIKRCSANPAYCLKTGDSKTAGITIAKGSKQKVTLLLRSTTCRSTTSAKWKVPWNNWVLLTKDFLPPWQHRHSGLLTQTYCGQFFKCYWRSPLQYEAGFPRQHHENLNSWTAGYTVGWNLLGVDRKQSQLSCGFPPLFFSFLFFFKLKKTASPK